MIGLNGSTRLGQKNKPIALGMAAVFALALGACGGSSDNDAEGLGGGSIFISGSSTVEPISVAVGEAFGEETGLVPDVEGPGTGDGFKKFCSGETDISDASRPIKDEEAASCKEAGVEFVELKFALDALTVMTSPENDAVSCLTLEDLYGLVGPDPEGVDTWAAAKAKGATTALPDAPLEIFAPGTESGTYDSFWELAIKSTAEDKLGDAAEDQLLRPDYGGLANDNEILEGIESSATSFGWVGYAFASKEGDRVKVISIDGGEGCVEPSAETVSDGSYPLSRALYIYVNAGNLKTNPDLAKFVDYYLSDDGIAKVADVGYVSLSDEDLQATRDAWATANK